MKTPETLVPSLDLCKEFARVCEEKGVEVPDTAFCYIKHDDIGWEATYLPGHHWLHAPTSGELGEMCCSKNYRLESDYIEGDLWQCRTIEHLSQKAIWKTLEKREQDARLKMLTYLIDQGLVTSLK